MHASKSHPFDAIAAEYDNSFSQSLTGASQRLQARKWLSYFLRDKKCLRILEINCGTGDDAVWLAGAGHRVVATDASATMIEVAKKKQALSANAHSIQFFQCAFNELQTLLPGEKFDLIFSNFSGLNCIPADELRSLNASFQELLKPGGHMAVVIFGKYNWWEVFYYLLKMSPGKAFRRWRQKQSLSQLKAGHFQPAYYYSINRFCRLLNQFSLVEKRPVGLFVPPSYAESLMKKNRRLFHLLEKLERKAGGIAAFSQLADHSYLLLKKT